MQRNKEISVEARINRICAKLADVVRRELRPFACASHGFRFEPVADEAELTRFEASLGVTLPAEYRAFITRVGDGGAGPAYGLLSLRRGLNYDAGDNEKDPARLRVPFPYTQFYNGPDLTEYDPANPDGPPRTGSLTVGDEGCYHRFFLVVTGSARGEIWMDWRTCDGGYWPMGVGFLDWYERWLDDALSGGDGIWWRDYTPPGYVPS